MRPTLTQPLALTPSAQARASLVAEFLVPSPQRTLATVGAISKKLALPFGETDLRRFLLARSGASEALIGRIDLDKPVSAVLVAPPPAASQDAGAAQAGPLVVVAFALRDPTPAGFDAFAAAAGRPAERVQDAMRIQRGDGGGPGPFWLLPREGAVCAADSVPALVAAGALALEARQARSEDLRVAVLPDGLARAAGTTVPAALAKLRQDVAAQRAAAVAGLSGGPGLAEAGGQLAESMVGFMLDAVADIQEVRTALSLRSESGLGSVLEVVPRKGSRLGRAIAPRHPYAVDPALLTGDPPGALWAMGDLAISHHIFNAIREPLLAMAVPEPDRPKVAASIDTIFASVAGPWAGRFSYQAAPKLALQYDVVYSLAPGADPAKLLASLEGLVKAPWLSRLLAVSFKGMLKVKIDSRREGPVLLTRVAFDTKKLPPSVRAELKGVPFLDGPPIEARTVIAGNRMIVSVGPSSKARLAALQAAAAPPAPPPDLAAALGETKGADGLYYADLAALLRPALGFAAAEARAGGGGGAANTAAMMGMAGTLLETARLATWGSYRGGETLSISGRIPFATFESVATLVRAATGLGRR
jgi:hypothetical protein